jgi:hypothetical protein
VLIAFIVLHITASKRTIAGNLVVNARRGGGPGAIFNLTHPQADQRWPIDGTAHEAPPELSAAAADPIVGPRSPKSGRLVNPHLPETKHLRMCSLSGSSALALCPGNARASRSPSPVSGQCYPADTRCLLRSRVSIERLSLALFTVTCACRAVQDSHAPIHNVR